MFTTHYNRKLTILQLKLFNYLSKEHNLLVEFIISFLYFLLEKFIRLVDIVIMPFFKVLSFLVMLVFFLIASIPLKTNINTIAIPRPTAIVKTTVNYPIAIINATNIVTSTIKNIPPPLLLLEEKTLLMLPFVEAEEKVIDEIDNISNPYVKEATKKKREQLENIAKYKGTLLDIDKIKDCASFLTIPNDSKPFIHYCNNRFCPVCANIKATKNANIIKEVLTKARESKKTLLYATFTTRNVEATELTREIEKINTAFTKTLTVPKKLKENVKGYVKKLEIKYNPINSDYNVHIHTALAVINYYKDHITTEEFYTNFKKYLKDDSIIPPSIKKIGNEDKDIIKVANYISKEDLIQNLSFSDEISDNIYNAVKNKRLLEFCLSFRDLKREVESTLASKVNTKKNKMPLLTTLTWDNNKKIYIN
jgi:plasmid rolling circle replication initiator protein Rep